MAIEKLIKTKLKSVWALNCVYEHSHYNLREAMDKTSLAASVASPASHGEPQS